MRPALGVDAPSGGFRKGAFGVTGSGDTSGFGGLVRVEPGGAVALHSTERPYGGYFDEVTDALIEAVGAGRPTTPPSRGCWSTAARSPTSSPASTCSTLVQALRDDDALRFELCSSVSGVDYLDSGGPVATPDRPRLHVVYHLTSMTYRRRIRLEVAVTAEDPHVPSVTAIYPTADWHERETWDMFGIVFDGHPALTRILMPDDWDGHPQRKDYPLGGVPVEYHDATIPPPGHPAGATDEHHLQRGRPVRRLARDHRGPRLHRHRRRLGPRPSADPHGEERLVVNMGPQHPSTHGVLRLVLDLEGETVTKARVVIGYLHTGIEKNTEYRNWTQGTTFVTRMDYLAPLFNEAAYCMAVEKLLGIEVAAARADHPRAGHGDQPDRLAPGRAGHRRHGDWARSPR